MLQRRVDVARCKHGRETLLDGQKSKLLSTQLHGRSYSRQKCARLLVQ